MIKPRQEWQIYAELYEKEIKRLNDYIGRLKRRTWALCFVYFALGMVLSALFTLWVMK